MARHARETWAGLPRRWVLPALDEPVPVEFYRFAARGRLTAYVVLVALDWLFLALVRPFGLDPRVYLRFAVANTALLGVAAVLALIVWRGERSLPVLRRLTLGCIVAEGVSTLLLQWIADVDVTFVATFGLLLVLGSRVFFDFTAGFVAMVVLVGGMWAYSFAELAGLLPVAPLLHHPASTQSWGVRILGLGGVTMTYLLTFLTASLVVVRVRHGERAVRVLREHFAVAEPGALGRHSGRTLRDTWVLGRVLGRGGMGEVYRGFHRTTHRPVAVKVLLPHLLDDSDVLARFRREAEVTAALGSPHIVEVIDVDHDEEAPYIVYELLHGESLTSRIARWGRLPLEEVVQIIVEAAAGLSEAHRVGVIHRDLKPENLFLASEGTDEVVKILDFGVSKMLGRRTVLTQDLGVLGTPGFMSPEQACGLEVDQRTDVYALGAITYACLAGVAPFQGASVPAMLHRACTEEPVPIGRVRADLPAAVEDVIAIAMAKRISERYVTAAELARDLEKAATGELPEAVSRRARALWRGTPAPMSDARLRRMVLAETEVIRVAVKGGGFEEP